MSNCNWGADFPYYIYCDLDGVLADFYGAFEERFHIKYKDTPTAEKWSLIREYEKSHGTSWFYDLPPTPWAYKLVEILKEYPFSILTATGEDYLIAGTAKKLWCQRYFGIRPSHVHVVRKSELKAGFANPWSILIDDSLERSVEPFRQAGGNGYWFRGEQSLDTLYYYLKHLNKPDTITYENLHL